MEPLGCVMLKKRISDDNIYFITLILFIWTASCISILLLTHSNLFEKVWDVSEVLSVALSILCRIFLHEWTEGSLILHKQAYGLPHVCGSIYSNTHTLTHTSEALISYQIDT